MASVLIENLAKAFRGPRGESIRAVHGIDLSVERGEFLVVVGPSGCGKTTLLRLIAGLETPDRGSITLDGRPLAGVAPRDRDIAMVFQSQALYPHMTARENLAFSLKLRGVSRQEIFERVAETAGWLGLDECLDRLPAELSGGQRQRVALGRAAIRRPRLLLLDEPLSHLDEPLRLQMQREFIRLHARLGVAIIHVTHDQAEAMSLGRRVAVLNGGALEQVDTPERLYRQPANLFVAGFTGTPPMNFLRGRIARQAGRLVVEITSETAVAAVDPSTHGKKPPSLPLPLSLAERFAPFAGQEVQLGVRPEQIELQPDSTDAEGAWTLPAQVESSALLGHAAQVHLLVCGAPWVVRLRGTAAPKIGQPVILSFDPAAAHFFDAAIGKALFPATENRSQAT